MSTWNKANHDRHLSTVGIGPVFVRSPPYVLSEEECCSAVESNQQSEVTSSDPVLAWEIVGTMKSRPEDFVVREISYLPSSRGGFYPRVAGLDETSDCRLSSDFIDRHACRKIVENLNYPDEKATTIIDQDGSISKDAVKDAIPAQDFDSSTKLIDSERLSTYNLTPNQTEQPVHEECQQSQEEKLHQILQFCCSGNNAQQSGVACVSRSSEVEKVFFSDDKISFDADTILEELGLLQELALDEIHDIWRKGCAMNSNSVAIDQSKYSELHNRVWIPTSKLFQDTESSCDLKEMWKQLHQCIRMVFPLLKTEVSNSGPSTDMLYCDVDGGDLNVTCDTDTSTPRNSTKPWVYAQIDKLFYPLAPYLALPRVDLLALYKFRREGPVRSGCRIGHHNPKKRKRQQPQKVLKEPHDDWLNEDNNTVLLRLRPGLPKDGRRSVHNILSSISRNRARDFDTFTKSNVPLDAKDDNMKALTSGSVEGNRTGEIIRVSAVAVQWSRMALAKSTHNQKDGSMSKGTKDVNYSSTLCVLRKEQMEHQAAVYELARTIKCRPFDIGLAGIKDMQAITYQFCSLRNIDIRRACQGKRSIKNAELSQFETLRPGFLLNRGMLLGNRFVILVRDMGCIERKSAQTEDHKATMMEHIVPCRASHIRSMVKRIEESGFVNFYGEQRVGSAGVSKLAGVRSFDVGRAMLQQDFSKALDLVMTGRSDMVHSPSEDEIRVRRVWRSSGGNARATLDAFPKKSSIMVRERDLMKGLLRFGDALEAFRGIPRNVRMFWIHAYQSYVWNLAATERIKRWGARPVVGDLYLTRDEDRDLAEQVHIVSKPESVDISQVVLPLPGYRIQYPSNEIGQLYKDILKHDSVLLNEKCNIPEASAKGSYRKLVQKAYNMSWEIVLDQGDNPVDRDSDPVIDSARFQFDLRSGCYATMLFREMFYTTMTRGSLDK